jgi:hypothetical protein
LIYGQIFQNIIRFSVITKNDPQLAEAIIENFEDFMDTYTPVFKRLGLSEFLYARREPDDEGTRAGTDICTRTVAYLVTIEKVHRMNMSRIQNIVVGARLFLSRLGDEFSVTGTNLFLNVQDHTYVTDDIVEIREPGETQVGDLPPGLNDGWIYYVGETTKDTVQLLSISGAVVDPGGPGVGRILLVSHGPEDNIDHIIEDQHQTVTT